MANQEEVKGWDKVVRWYQSKAYAVNIVYSLGASVVIVGALFKILHWPGASQVLMVGMFTESFLFILGVFEKPHAAYHWENVFPQLIGEEVKEMLGGSGVAGAPAAEGAVAEKKNHAAIPAIEEEDLKALKEGINALGKTAQQLSTLGAVADSTAKLNDKMNAASEAMERFATSQEGLAESANQSASKVAALGAQYEAVAAGMNEVVRQTENYGKGIEAVNAQIGSLNSVYELQLNSIKAQAAAFDVQTSKINGVGGLIDDINTDVKKLNDATKSAAKASEAYEEASAKLAQQVADLNKVYGNMLNALA